MALNLSSLAGVADFAGRLRAAYPGAPIAALVLNAGVQHVKLERTADGLEHTFGVNHVAHWQLACLLLPALDAKKGRIVLTASGVHDPAMKTVRGVSVFEPRRKMPSPPPQKNQTSATTPPRPAAHTTPPTTHPPHQRACPSRRGKPWTTS
jgi:NAD(P)-dependent dehydrogenase (short-subunit alcohol dehydrogenase family)